MSEKNDASWIDRNVEVVQNYLQKEFENFVIAYRADQSLTHTFTVNNGKKRFTLFVGWPILADRRFTREGIDRLSKQNIAEEMRLHGEDGYHWAPSNEDPPPHAVEASGAVRDRGEEDASTLSRTRIVL